MPVWIRVYDEDRDLWQYFEGDEAGQVTRQVELRGDDGTPVTAASLEEVLRFQECSDVDTMSRYQRRYGTIAEGRITDRNGAGRAGEISAEEFERIWLDARRTLGSATP
ncbi:hypothetical protein [Streptomyces antimicrobicus]|uniref:Uncharacterized protein n=1 Tax=Streptomyces antimicrobicus TaxID=2883108 RepID=A0ABS8B063_9ACTN|nr:hypothetical protein [Streptomyces antimicrobicus]MCB5177955.1 hypothetical protein [Streptomyces antimicrobicus]